MTLLYPLKQIQPADQQCVGGKAYALARMVQQDLPVPMALCVSTQAYHWFLDETGLRARILMEYHRKAFDQMRWEEMWDCSLRIQNLFARTDMPEALATDLREAVDAGFGQQPVAVRSSAVGEDSARSSFAGLHASYLNIKGSEHVLSHIKLVWASTWSDAAILYRREIGLDVEKSDMAVVIQALVQGQQSGVIFGRSPVDPTQAVIEAVHGLNQGLVDGTIEPDRWVLARDSGTVLSHIPAQRIKTVVPAARGIKVIRLPMAKRNRSPLTPARVKAVFGLERRLARLLGSDQDVEWTYDRSRLQLLQSRPITTTAGTEDTDDRQWYLSLRRNFDNLVDLREKIENDMIPAMATEADALKRVDLIGMTDTALAQEISRRQERCDYWKQQYWDFCIPFAHGIRLFGMVYNRTVQPEDPYEFMELLAGTPLQSVKRNEMLQRLADRVNKDKRLKDRVRSGTLSKNASFTKDLAALADELRLPWSGKTSSSQLQAKLLDLVMEMARKRPAQTERRGRAKSGLKRQFLAAMPKQDRAFGLQLLDLACASYRLRDDDNIYLGRVEKRLLDALQEAYHRSAVVSKLPFDMAHAHDIAQCLRDVNYRPKSQPSPSVAVPDKRVKPRQLLGQPAGPGLATGRARIIKNSDDLFAFKKGEVVVCDAIDPNMTFVVPLASAIVERRGGMLIHGAIIAREYGLPCVTGIPEADRVISTGDSITVDGYLGIVTIRRN